MSTASFNLALHVILSRFCSCVLFTTGNRQVTLSSGFNLVGSRIQPFDIQMVSYSGEATWGRDSLTA